MPSGRPLLCVNRWVPRPFLRPRSRQGETLGHEDPEAMAFPMILSIFVTSDASADRPVYCDFNSVEPPRPFAIVFCYAFPRVRPWPPWPCNRERLDTPVFKRARWTAEVGNCPALNFTPFTNNAILPYRTSHPNARHPKYRVARSQ